MDTVTGQIWRS